MRQYLSLICTCFIFFLQLTTYAQHQVVAPGQLTGKFALPAGNCAFKYNWTNDHPEIGLPAFGTGDIPPFTAINNTNSAITANIKVETAGLAYVGSAFSNIVTVTDLATSQAMPSVDIGAGNSASYQVTSRDGKRVYLLSYNSRKLISINTADNAVSIIDIGPSPASYMALNADGSRLYVSINNAGAVKVFNTANLSPMPTIFMPVPGNLVVSADDSKLYVIGLNSIREVNTATNAVVSYPVLPQPSSVGMAITADGKDIYMSSFSNDVVVFSTETKTVTTTIPTMGTNAVDLAFSSDGNTLYVSNLVSRDIAVIDTRTKTLRSTIDVSYSPNGLDVSATGSRLFVVSPGDKQVYIYNTADQQLIGTVATGPSPTAIGSFIVPGACPAVNYSITVTGPSTSPDIQTTGTPTSVSTNYGTSSASTGFGISATGLSAPIQVTAPAGFEVSIDDATFNTSLLIPGTNGVANAQVYIRLAAYANAGINSGNVILSTLNASDKTIPIPNSVVSKAPLTITLSNVQKTYGDRLLIQANANTGFTAIGLKNGDVITGVTKIFGAGAAGTDPVGVYPGGVDCNTPSGSNFNANNYDFTSQRADILVNKAVLTVTADNKSRVFGMPDPVFTYSVIGFVNNESPAQINVLPQASTSADAASPAGAYPISVAGAAADNYSFIYVGATLTVDPLIPPGLMVPNAFTPNGDGINDIWVIRNIESVPNCVVDIFNRSGQKVFTSIGYSRSWDGSYKNINAPTGAYYYIIDPRNGDAKLSGTLTLIR